MKIARGKVRDSEDFTCPICDWRVKIPRDAARPKLEDLQEWQIEIQGLPFQPDEEDVLDRIIRRAADFRAFVGQFINPNNVSGSTEEMPTMLFYLRKLEGAEVLLAYETNLFRQELHKWQPIAPEPPPILDRSGSTRKPRPTKQQKMMLQMGLSDPSELPQQYRTRPHSFHKRKSTDNSLNKSQMQPQVQSSARDSSSEQTVGRTATPSGMTREDSAGNVPMGNGYEMPPATVGTSQTGNAFDSPYSGVQRSGSPLFAQPNSSVGPLRETSFATDGFKNDHDALPLFEEPEYDRDLRAGLADTAAKAEKMMDSSPPPQSNVDDMFAEMTNQDGDTQENHSEGLSGSHLPAADEHETSHASEALDALNDAKEGDPSGDAIEADKEGVGDFLET